MALLLLADHDDNGLSDHTAKALNAALQIDPEVDILVAGVQVGSAAKAAAELSGVRRVLHADDTRFEGQMVEPLTALVVSLAGGYGTFLAPATSVGKSVAPRVAALLDVAQLSEIIEVVSPDTFKRLIYAGNAVQTLQTTGAMKVITVRSAAFSEIGMGGAAQIVTTSMPDPVPSARFLENKLSNTERPDLSSARVIVSGGRALGSSEQFRSILLPFADKLGAAVGASRAAVDAGYAPNDWQVGQTGKIVAPDLYIAVGISGAIQHLAGMKDSKVIVAINKDEEAPIFQVADYALVGDLFDIIPQLTERL
jgi:electron transfer flavoprotein alpha subunit